ncbi:maltotransferase domain-containing protein [Methyloversatilis sp.]|uniref:alpha-1,4-glucan--maltose-1-phosphate maltosyltransferase n=1 Tax=Methyloversatilis sp. TaxID=2569862 RepID=UPI003D2AD7E9
MDHLSDLPAEGRIRAVVSDLTPAVDGGRFAVKRSLGETLTVEANCFADGHDAVLALLCWRRDDESATTWHAVPMQPLGNDRWRATLRPDRCGRWWYSVSAWVNPFRSWRSQMARRTDDADIRLAALEGASLAEAAALRAGEALADRNQLLRWAERLRNDGAHADAPALKALALDDTMAEVAARHPDRRWPAVHAPMPLDVNRALARFGAWYELFPRSLGEGGRHGRFDDVIARLPAIAAMGFDVLYLPPVHPIGRVRRKGRNGVVVAGRDEPGSPWAIGAAEGGHTAVHPQLGTLDDFRRLVGEAERRGIDIALDIALQCAPDHPWVTDCPQWFRRRPDGSVQYAENPPKKYQDIYPFDFECEDWRGLWQALAGIFRHWIAQGVKVFRVDNPHTKSFAFWEWLIGTLRREHPDLVFLSEAFTRPQVMHRLAKLGFNQSYTYFTWRNTRAELTDYLEELSAGPGRDYFRPNLWPNTPDILPEYLQSGGRPAFVARLVLAATLGTSYGIYGPAFERMEARPREPGSEEYLDSEKYQLREGGHADGDGLAPLIATINRIRRDNPALQFPGGLRFLPVDNEQLIAYAKHDAASGNAVVVVVNLDPHHVHTGWLELDPAAYGGSDDEGSVQMHDLLGGERYQWAPGRNFVRLDPQRLPAHVFQVRRRVRSERDFDYYL